MRHSGSFKQKRTKMQLVRFSFRQGVWEGGTKFVAHTYNDHKNLGILRFRFLRKNPKDFGVGSLKLKIC